MSIALDWSSETISALAKVVTSPNFLSSEISLRSLRIILPLRVFGKSAVITILFGLAIGPILSLTCCLNSDIKFSSPSSVPINETNAAIASPDISSVLPITAASATAS